MPEDGVVALVDSARHWRHVDLPVGNLATKICDGLLQHFTTALGNSGNSPAFHWCRRLDELFEHWRDPIIMPQPHVLFRNPG